MLQYLFLPSRSISYSKIVSCPPWHLTWAEPIHIWIWMPNMEIFYYDVYNWHFRGRTAKKMESEKEKCGNCGKTFALKGKSYDRKSFNANLKLKTIDKTTKRFVYEFTSMFLIWQSIHIRISPKRGKCTWNSNLQTKCRTERRFHAFKFSDGYKSTMDWCSVYSTPQALPKYIYLSPLALLIFPTTYNRIRTKNRPVWITSGAAPLH